MGSPLVAPTVITALVVGALALSRRRHVGDRAEVGDIVAFDVGTSGASFPPAVAAEIDGVQKKGLPPVGILIVDSAGWLTLTGHVVDGKGQTIASGIEIKRASVEAVFGKDDASFIGQKIKQALAPKASRSPRPIPSPTPIAPPAPPPPFAGLLGGRS